MNLSNYDERNRKLLHMRSGFTYHNVIANAVESIVECLIISGSISCQSFEKSQRC